MLPRFGVNSVLDTPKLVFLDQRIDVNENRQVKYSGTIDEASVAAFLEHQMGLPLAEAAEGGAAAVAAAPPPNELIPIVLSAQRAPGAAHSAPSLLGGAGLRDADGELCAGDVIVLSLIHI